MDNSIIDATKLTDYCCADSKFNNAIGHIDLTKNAELLAQLRDLKDKSGGETKCTICKAIQELEKPKAESYNSTNTFDWTWIMLLMLMFWSNFNNNSDTFDAFAKACAKVYEKENEDSTNDLSDGAK